MSEALENNIATPLADVVAARFPEAGLRRLLPHADALRGLLGSSDEDLLLRFAVVEELARHPRTRWTREALASALAWLDTEPRERTLAALRRGGWIERSGHDQLQLSERGAGLLAVLGEVFGALPGDAGELALGVVRLEWVRHTGAAPGPLLRHLLHQVHRVLDDLDRALGSRSEAAIERAGRRLERNLAWASKAREILEGLTLEGAADLDVARNLGRSLARLHQGVGRLQVALNALGRRRIPLGRTGLSMADVAAWVGRCPPTVLAQLAHGHLAQPVRPVLGIVDNLLTEAEGALLDAWYDERTGDGRGWEGAVAGPAPADDDGPGLDVAREAEVLAALTADILAWSDGGTPVPLRDAVDAPRFEEVAHRLAMLALAEDGALPFDPEQLEGRWDQLPTLRIQARGGEVDPVGGRAYCAATTATVHVGVVTAGGSR